MSALLLMVLLIGATMDLFSADKPAAHSSSGVVVHKRLSYFIDIEAPVSQVWVGCTEDNSKKTNSWMIFHIVDGDLMYEFMYRRVLSVPICLSEEREYRQMLRGAKTVRIVGVHPDEIVNPQPETSKRIPQRFAETQKSISIIFSRLEAKGHCKAFFTKDCDLPKNYWAGMIPGPE